MLDPQAGRDAEADRIIRVYEQYGASPALAARYAADNPGNQAMVAERDQAVSRLLGQAGLLPLTGRRVLDVGCGFGHELAGMCRMGARAEDLVGVDLVPERVERARLSFPAIDYRIGSAVELELEDESVDVVLCYTLFSSILDRLTASRAAAEIARVLKPGGAVAWYDLRYPSVANRNVRAIRADEVRAMFPGFSATLSPITLIPPLARRLGSLTPTLYPTLARLGPLRSHLVGALVKVPPDEPSPTP